MESQTWIIRTSVQLDNDDNDQISYQVDEETYHHDVWMTAGDFGNGSDIIEETKDSSGRLVSVTFEWFAQDFDRSAEAYYPILVTKTWERQIPAHVEVFERGGGFVAAGNAEQWMTTHDAIERLEDSVAVILNRNPYDDDLNLIAKLRRLRRLVEQSYSNAFTADQFGRMSTELFASEAELIREAITA